MRDLTTGNERILILKFALPMLLGSVFQQFYNIVDSIIVGNYLGKEALSAVGASFPVFFTLISLIIGIASGAGIVISQFFGAKQYDKVQLGVDTLFIILFSASIFISISGIVFSENIFRLIDLPDDILPQAKIYLIITLSGLIFDFGYNGIAAVLRSMGDSRTPLYFLIISTVSNIFLDLLFVIVFELGIEGVAAATVISKFVAFVIGIIYVNRKHKIIKISIFKLKFNKDIFFKSLKIGLPSGLQHMFVALGMVAVFKIVNGFGTVIIAAYSVAGRIDSFAIMPAMNFAQALTAFTGQNIGAGKIDRVKKGMRASLIMSILFSLMMSIVVIFGGTALMNLFTPDKDVINAGYDYLLIVGSSYIIFSVMFTFTGVFRGAGDTIVPMFITLITLWLIRIPLSYYLSVDFAEKGIWYSIPIAWFIGAISSVIYFYTGKWKTKSVVQKKV